MIRPAQELGILTRECIVEWAKQMYEDKKLTKEEVECLVFPRPCPSTIFITREEFILITGKQ